MHYQVGRGPSPTQNAGLNIDYHQSMLVVTQLRVRSLNCFAVGILSADSIVRPWATKLHQSQPSGHLSRWSSAILSQGSRLILCWRNLDSEVLLLLPLD